MAMLPEMEMNVYNRDVDFVTLEIPVVDRSELTKDFEYLDTRGFHDIYIDTTCQMFVAVLEEE